MFCVTLLFSSQYTIRYLHVPHRPLSCIFVRKLYFSSTTWEHFLDVCVIQVTSLHSNHDYLHYIIAISTQWASLWYNFGGQMKKGHELDSSWGLGNFFFFQSNSTWEFFFLILVISSNKTPLLLPWHVVLPHISRPIKVNIIYIVKLAIQIGCLFIQTWGDR